jgi:transposase
LSASPLDWSTRRHFAGFDWAHAKHQVVIVDLHGQVVADFTFEHSAAGWQLWQAQAAQFGPLAVCIETSSGAIVERLLETPGVTVFPVNPKAAKAYRERKAPSGVKTDFHDAWSFADALRVDGHGWRALAPTDPLLAELRLLCRDEIELIEERTALINQVQAALREYYPVLLQAFSDWGLPAAWAFLLQFPTPAALAQAGRRRWEKFLHTHKLFRPETAETRLALFAQAAGFTAGPAITQAKSRLAQARARQLQTLERELQAYRTQIERLFAQHPDHDLFGSLPGAGPKLAPRLLAELGDDRTLFADAQALQCHAGTAPVSFQSGQICKAKIRWHCQKNLRATVHLWADLSRRSCTWANVYYQAARQRGKSHACALRCLGQRWLKILWKMWQTKTCYDAELHAKNQQAHGSWLLALQPVPITLKKGE